ncbi:MAG: hypothetical protein JSS86_13600 [Cyanobacteria bacterium SZAS LIN-2]|nr:hypothetical protein [Cyanobacteria bacterium SZAS LIN-3]MBS1997348.1 hypothetical protein [Cyanobacteria bacterium SZAS LIN-2]MBS2010341.1 hypothetical protein [Cyanobacteria bacterium SZAS TMP-1]
MQRHNAHVEGISLVARQLSKIGIDPVFTGGSIVGLLLTDTAAPDVRPTDDVDVIVSIARYSDYAALQDALRKVGFKHDMKGPNCRFILDELKVDVMPSEGKVLGFTNTWYEYALRSASIYELPDGNSIRLISAPAFIGTKLEAFHDRGNQDFLLSHDLEDIIAVIDGRPELLEEVKAAEADIRQYIETTFARLIDNQDFIDAVKMNLLPDEGSQGRAKVIIERIRSLSLPT